MYVIKRSFSLAASALIVAISMLLCFTSAFAQINTAKIEGTVRDMDTGAPLQGAQVIVEGTQLGNVTNADGYYFILNVPPGRRSITFTYTGYQKTTVANQLILAGQTETIDGNLSSTIVELAGITIEGESEVLMPRDQTVTKQRMTAEKIAESPTTTLDDLMLLEAGVETGGPEAFGRGVRIRGGRLGEEAMIVDGVIVRNYTADPFRSGQGWIYEHEVGSKGEDTTPLEFSTSAVEQVDIITGGFQAEYGNAQSGIINIVTKEGGADLRGSVRFTTDGVMPRTADWGYNQLWTSIGGPVPGISNLFFHGSGEIQGVADRTPTHADEGFRGINQDFVDRLNYSVRNDPVLGAKEIQPVYTLDMFRTGREFYASKTGESASLFSPKNPVRNYGNWRDRTLVSGKLTYYPTQRLKFIGTGNFSRHQHSYPWGNGDYFQDGKVTESTLPSRYWKGDYPDTIAIFPQGYGRRTRTTNTLAGFNWDFLKSAERSASLQFRFNNFRTQDINNAWLKDNYLHDDTFMSWTPHDIPFEIETFPNREGPIYGSEEAKIYYPDGVGGRLQHFENPNPLGLTTYNILLMDYRYLYEKQYNYKADIDFQFNRQNRAKLGFHLTNFKNHKFSGYGRRDVANEFRYNPRMQAFYAQNRTDLGDFVFDYGIRYDRFSPRANWGFRSGDEWEERFFPKPIDEWSPRFDVGFPVTDKTQLRFAYGIFTQMPSMSYIFSGSNPGGLEFSRSDSFESGLSYLLSDDMVLDLVAYYRDVEGNVASKEFFRDYYQWHAERRIRGYSTGYTNRDNGNIKGMDFTLRKRFSQNYAFNLSYTLQFSRTTGSNYASTTDWDLFLDPSTGDRFVPPDEIRPIDGDRAHKFTTSFNYLFPDDFMIGTWANMVFKNVRAYVIFKMRSGQPLTDRVSPDEGKTEHLSVAENVTWLTRRGPRAGRPVGGQNYFRGPWFVNFDLRFTKSFNFGGTKRLRFFSEIFNAFNHKPPTPYPSGYTYESRRTIWTGGVELPWRDDMMLADKLKFNSDFNGDGLLTLMEAAQGAIAASMMGGTMDKTAYGVPRQVRLGLEFTY